MGSIDLVVDLSGVDEQHVVGTVCVLLASVEEPERDGQGDGVEHVRTGGDNHIDAPALDEPAADFEFTASGIGRRVGHDEAGPAGVTKG